MILTCRACNSKGWFWIEVDHDKLVQDTCGVCNGAGEIEIEGEGE